MAIECRNEFGLRTCKQQEGGHDEAVKGVDAVAHLASPYYMTGVKDPQELIQPALRGTTEVLKSVQRHKWVWLRPFAVLLPTVCLGG